MNTGRDRVLKIIFSFGTHFFTHSGHRTRKGVFLLPVDSPANRSDFVFGMGIAAFEFRPQ
jgi:hypothetical protein